VIYKTKMVVGPNRNFEVFDPLDFLASVTSHIPNRGEHLVRYHGYCSSVQRGRCRRQGWENVPLQPVPSADDISTAKTMRVNWARFIRQVFAADPLICPECGKRRIALLVDGVRVECRCCLGVKYRVQSMGPYDRRERRRERMGAKFVIADDGLPDRPYQMRWKTYNRLWEEYERLR
jgi:hypothetical protein